jgi:D-sedoheptulose 7-phosphate isomerase
MALVQLGAKVTQRLGATLDALQYVRNLQHVLDRIDLSQLKLLSDWLFEAWQQERFVYIFGNGGSGTSATHMSEDLGKNTLRTDDLRHETKKRLKVISLTDNIGWIMAVGNDLGYDQIFVQQLMNYGSPDDLAIAISGSGNSSNVINAVEWANRKGLKTFGMTGFDGGQLKRIQQAGVHVPVPDMGTAESIHLALYHWVLDDLYARINSEGRYGK